MTTIADLIDRPTWHADATCRNLHPSIFFPHDQEGVHQAEAICRGCPVRAECLAYALTMGEKHGVWGGVSERGRQRMRYRLARQKKESADQ